MAVFHLKKYIWRNKRIPKKIDRTTKFGNPFVIGQDGDRTEVIQKFKDWAYSQPEVLKSWEELRGHDLLCWCKPLACHGDVIEEYLYGEKNDQKVGDKSKEKTDSSS